MSVKKIAQWFWCPAVSDTVHINTGKWYGDFCVLISCYQVTEEFILAIKFMLVWNS